jgi:hypothetical protein
MRLGMSVLRVRHLLLLAWILELTVSGGQAGDWLLLTHEAHSMFSATGLHVYTTSPPPQAGPLSLAVVRVMALAGRRYSADLAEVLNALVGWVLVMLVERTAVRVRGLPSADGSPALMATTFGLGLLVLQVWGQLTGTFLHTDDVLAGAAIVLTALWTAEDRSRAAGLAAGAAVCCKPWAVAAVPLLMGLHSRRRVSLGCAAAVIGACWLPFFIAAPHSVGAGGYGYPISPESPVRFLGMHSRVSPGWLRDTELLGIPIAGVVAARRRAWYAAAGAALLVRLLLDPLAGDLYYYTAVPMLCLAGYEMAAGGVPWRTPVLWVGMWLDTFVLPMHSLAAVSCITLIVLLADMCLWPGRHRMPPPGSRAAGPDARDPARSLGRSLGSDRAADFPVPDPVATG